MSRFHLFTASGLVLILVIVVWLVFFQEAQEQITAPPKYEVFQRGIREIPIVADQSATISAITASSFSVRDVASGAVLLEKDSHAKLYPASTTKLVTALVALEHYQLDQVLIIPSIPLEYGTRPDLRPGETFTVKSLLQALLISSNNEAAYTLAYYHSGGVEGFVADMNAKAAQLSLQETNFQNPVGFDDPAMVSTANDLSILGRAIMQNEFLRGIVSQTFVQIQSTDGSTYPLYTTNELLAADQSVKGIKTGTTEGAQQVLMTYSETNGHPITIVLLNSTDRYQDTRLLMEWVRTQVTWKNPQELSF